MRLVWVPLGHGILTKYPNCMRLFLDFRPRGTSWALLAVPEAKGR